ncbi:MAG TPA: branched-chain amino acid ABC transporter substrate-binding protein [Stellaceae bacterium]|nr:branched-chain amino acid ABC transporter substrate-binding protein [Stellaceae bacterium]
MRSLRKLVFVRGVALCAAVGWLAAAQAAETKGPVTDEIGVLVIPKGAPIEIGGYWVLSGADTALGLDQKRAVEIAVKEKKALVGHPIKFTAEDSLCNAEGGQTAATKLASNPRLAIVIGPSCSSEATPGAPILWKAGITSIGTSPTAPKLTAPERGAQYDGFVRTCYSDIFQGASDAKYIHDVLKAKTIVAVHDGSPYAQGLAGATADAFTKLGGKVLSTEAIQPTDVDMHPMLTRVATEKPDVLYFPIFVAAGAQILRQAKDIPGLKDTKLLGSSGMLAPDFIEAAKEAVVGFQITYTDLSPAAMGKGYPAFVEKYKKAYGEGPTSGYHAHAYDGAEMAFKAIEKVAKTDDKGNTYIGRKALRDAVFATTFDGISGPIKCDKFGECGEFHPAVYQYTNADPKTFTSDATKANANPKKIWP